MHYIKLQCLALICIRRINGYITILLYIRELAKERQVLESGRIERQQLKTYLDDLNKKLHESEQEKQKVGMQLESSKKNDV